MPEMIVFGNSVFDWLGSIHFWFWIGILVTLVIGYWIGRLHQRFEPTEKESQWLRETLRAEEVTEEIERVADRIRTQLVTHSSKAHSFRHKIKQLETHPEELAWIELCHEAESFLKPTLELATQLAGAYDELRQQAHRLMTFTDARTDPLTRMNNRRAIDEELSTAVARLNRYETPFCLAMFDIDHFKKVNDTQGHLYGDEVLRQVGQLFGKNIRQTDFVGRYGGEEFILIMPETSLFEGGKMTERFRRLAEETLSVTLSAGLTEAMQGDPPELIIARADEALYTAKAAGRNQVFRHNGEGIHAFPERKPSDASQKIDPAAILENRGKL